MDFLNNRVLLFFLAPRKNYRDVLVSRREVFLGPDANDEKAQGSWRCAKTPSGSFDAKAFCSEKGIPADVSALLVKADSTGRNFPRNLGAFKCPKVLLVGDTHHMQAPIRKLIEYAKSEPFDRIIFDHTRHHARWFFEAGLENLHWIPALDFTFQKREIPQRPSRKLTFIGQAGRFHPYRCHVLEGLRKAGLPLEAMQAPPSEAADLYADSQATLNIALNGDLNLRVFEALSAGGFLLTDRLTESSGLEALFKPGEDLEVWSGTEELIEKIRHYMENPAEAFRIRRCGQRKLLERHSPEVKIREFWDLVLHGTENPAYSLEGEKGAVPSLGGDSTIDLLPAYEFFQELHRTSSRLVFYCAESEKKSVRDFADLPRVECRSHGEFVSGAAAAAGDFPERRVFYVGPESNSGELLHSLLLKESPACVFAPGAGRDFLADWGYVQRHPAVFECGRPVRGMVRRAQAMGGEQAREILPSCVGLCINDTEAMELADACEAAGLAETRREALLRAVFLNRDCVPAYIQLADLCIDAGSAVDGALLLSEANRAAPLPDALAPVLDELMEKVREVPAAMEYRTAIAGGDHPLPAAKRRILVVTNLFPPQEMGGYGRKIWEFANGLRERGHEVQVLTSDSSYLGKVPDESELQLEPIVRRELVLMGEWKDGKTRSTVDPAGQKKVGEDNARRVGEAVAAFAPDFVLLGNLDFLGVELLNAVLARGIPVVHSLGNQTPWYRPEQSVKSPLYVVAPASDWLGKNLISQGYTVPRMETVYPGARIDRFYRHFLPDFRRLRIAFAGLVMAYKGPQILLDALIKLNQLGVDFEAEIAGDTITPDFVDQLKDAASKHGIADRVKFTGFLARRELSALFARSNVLVFPTQVPEAFGISQVEAMAGGLVVLTSGTGGTLEVVNHLEDGIVFDLADPMSLTRWLHQLANDQGLRTRLQAKARERALRFSVTASVVRIEDVAESLLARNPKPGGPEPADAPPVHATLENAEKSFSGGRLSETEDLCRALLGKDEKCAGAWNLMARLAFLGGDLESASDFATVARDLDPAASRFALTLGEVLLIKGEFEQAEAVARQAIGLAPDAAAGHVLLGRILAERNEQGDSMNAFQHALRLQKDDVGALEHYAAALQKFDRGKEALSQIRKAVSLAPESVELQTRFAMILQDNARYVDALAAFGKAARLNPNVGFVWFRQGKLLNGLKRYAEAIPILEKAVSLPCAAGEFHYELGVALHMTKKFQEALDEYDRAQAMGFNTAALQCNRGVIFKDLRKGGNAIMAFHAAVKMDPSNVSYLNNLGAAALEIGLNSEALDCFEEAARQNPKLPTAQNNIGNLLKDRARGMDALPHYRKAMELAPEDRDAPSNYLLCHMYLPEIDAKAVFDEHRKWGLDTAKKFPASFKFKPRDTTARWRVGFVSADLCHHPVAHFIEPLFRHYDRSKFEFFAYADHRKSDEFSERLSKLVDRWSETRSLDDKELARQIHSDRVDILFELSGHTAYNRLGVFAMKPAPVQASYLGYPGTTGLTTMDFRITDVFTDPVGMSEKFHTERLVRLPNCAWCYEPDHVAPDPGLPPFQRKGHVTFGCFNNMAKLNTGLFEMWAEVLKGAPGSRLRLKARTLADEGVKRDLRGFFSERGIEPDRLELFAHTQKIAEHLSHYNEVDIALDSFPYHGTTTTCEAMWMGVPVVTRAGETHVSRVGVSLLHAVGLQEFVCDSRAAYIEKAVALAADSPRLIALRPTMRQRMKDSLLMDGESFASDFSRALEEMVSKR